MSDTPRTDFEQLDNGATIESRPFVRDYFARELERENNQLRAQLAERDKLLDRLAEWCMDLKGEWDWKKDEPRAGNKAEYDQLCADIDSALRLTRRGSVT